MLYKNQSRSWPLSIKLAILTFIASILWLFNQYFVTPLLTGIILAILTYPIYDFCRRQTAKFRLKKWYIPDNASAFSTVFLVSFLFIFIAQVFVVQVVREAPSFINSLSSFLISLPQNEIVTRELGKTQIDTQLVNDLVNGLNCELNKLLSLYGQKINIANCSTVLQREDVEAALKAGSKRLQEVFSYFMGMVFFLLAWFQALLHGENWLNNLFRLLPFSKLEEKSIRLELKLGIQNVVYANLLSGLVHAAACFLLMLYFGIPNLFILTVLVFMIGVLPLSPSEMAYAIPLLLGLQKDPSNIVSVLIFIPVAELIILWVNYILVPGIIASQKGSNSLLILTSIVAGIYTFGLAGFIIGPIIMILAQTLYYILMGRIDVEEISKN